MISLQPLGDPDAVSCDGGVCVLPEVTPDEAVPDEPAGDAPVVEAGRSVVPTDRTSAATTTST